MASRYFLDANILLEILYDRPMLPAVKKLLIKHQGAVYISPLTVHLVFHFGLKMTNFKNIQTLLSDYQILPLDAHDVNWAMVNIRDNDFEDALQLAVAIRNGCDEFITLDKKLVDTYKGLPVIDVKLLA